MFSHQVSFCKLCPVSLHYIEDIWFFEVNTKYISSSELKTSEFDCDVIPRLSYQPEGRRPEG